MADNISIIRARTEGSATICSDAEGAEVRIGGGGPHATDLLLMAVAGCSMAVLKSLIKRDGMIAVRLDAEVEGVRSETSPKRYTDITIRYEIECPGLTDEKMQKYIKITEQACPVVQSLNAAIHETYKIIG